MKLVRFRVKNLRGYEGEFGLNVPNLMMVAGRNDVGKSTLFDAMNSFFNETKFKLDSDDGCKFGDVSDVRIICEFEDFPEELTLDAGFPTTLDDEHLLNEEGRLEIHQVWNCSLGTPKHTFWAWAEHPSVDLYNDLHSLKLADLKARADDLEVDLEGVDLRKSSPIRKAIWDSNPDLDFEEQLIPLEAEAGKKVWTQLKKSLPTFALFKSDRASTDADAEAQDPMKTAIKEAVKALDGRLQDIEEEIREQVQDIANKTVEKLSEMHPALAAELNPKFAKPNWASALKVGLTGEDDIPLNKRGSGVRRLVLLNFFRAKAEEAIAGRGGDVPVIYAFEEPETSQHPANQKLLLDSFMELAEDSSCQVFLTTHNPTLARRVPDDCIRYICNSEEGKVVRTGDKESWQLMAEELGVLPDHDVKLFIGVEGKHDINFLKGLSTALNASGGDVPDLEQLESDGKIIFIPCGGSNLAVWASRLAKLNKPEFHLFDNDRPEYQAFADKVDARENCKGMLTSKLMMENYLHPDAIVEAIPEAAGIVVDDDTNVPLEVARLKHEAAPEGTPWDEIEDEKKINKKKGNAKKQLNGVAVSFMSLERLKEHDPEDEVLGWFQVIGDYVNAE